MGISWTGTHMNSTFTPKCWDRSVVFKNIRHFCVQCDLWLFINSCIVYISLAIHLHLIRLLAHAMRSRRSNLEGTQGRLLGVFWSQWCRNLICLTVPISAFNLVLMDLCPMVIQRVSACKHSLWWDFISYLFWVSDSSNSQNLFVYFLRNWKVESKN